MGGKIILEDIKTVLDFLSAMGITHVPFEMPSKINLVKPIPKSMPILTGNKADDLIALQGHISDCTRCKLSKGRTNIVFGEGNPSAEIMFIGEGPGKDEDVQGRPFVGEAGQLLTKLIVKLGLKREDVYIGNIVKCRPPMNRTPESDEVETCIHFIKKQIEIIRPKVIVTLGNAATQSLLNLKTPISKLRGHFQDYQGIPLMPTFHPAYLLRNPKDKTLVWNDAIKVLHKIGRTLE